MRSPIIKIAMLLFGIILSVTAKAQIVTTNPLEYVALAEGNELILGKVKDQMDGQKKTALLQNTIAAEFEQMRQWEKKYNSYLKTASGFASSLKACTHLYYAKQRGVMIYFETGQETPTTLIRAIKDIATGNVFINCDLANLLMYGKANSLDAVKQFGSLIKEFHAKDGRYPDPNNPYELGAEVPIPTGEVNFPAVIAELKKQGFQGALTIECELNGARHDYVIKTREYLQTCSC